jgi:hypothetical protein
MSGYQSPRYAQALAEIGIARHLPQCNGWLLERSIPGNDLGDLVGCYPLFCCGDWSQLGADLDRLAERAITVSLVVDPFAEVSGEQLAAWFPDVCRAFKEHFIVDFGRDWRATIGAHHRRNIRAAARHVEIERCENPSSWLETWVELYGQLVRRHEIHGAARFSRASFAGQLLVPGIVVFRATVGRETVGMLLWYVQKDVAYYHLGAFSPLGYESRAAFALFEAALGAFAKRGLRNAALGAGAGWHAVADDGLTRFKQGWANDQRTAWFCGRVLRAGAYGRLVATRGIWPTEYFPAYRIPEAA